MSYTECVAGNTCCGCSGLVLMPVSVSLLDFCTTSVGTQQRKQEWKSEIDIPTAGQLGLLAAAQAWHSWRSRFRAAIPKQYRLGISSSIRRGSGINIPMDRQNACLIGVPTSRSWYDRRRWRTTTQHVGVCIERGTRSVTHNDQKRANGRTGTKKRITTLQVPSTR